MLNLNNISNLCTENTKYVFQKDSKIKILEITYEITEKCIKLKDISIANIFNKIVYILKT